LQGTILKKINKEGETVRLPVILSFLESGSARVVIDEEKRQKGEIDLRHNSIARKERYNEVESWAIVGGLDISKTAKEAREAGTSTVTYGSDNQFQAVITFAPFAIEFKRDGATQVKLNDRGLLNVEHWRPKIEKPEPEKKEGEETPAAEVEVPAGEDESTWWDEPFGGQTDSKPKGPESVSLDISFPGYEHVYGIPEHAGPLSLKETRGGTGNHEDPYRLYNADVFEYIMDSPMTLYGAIPFMQAHKKDSTVGVFWLNAAETWIDIIKEKEAHNPLSLGIGSMCLFSSDQHLKMLRRHMVSLLDTPSFLQSFPLLITNVDGTITPMKMSRTSTVRCRSTKSHTMSSGSISSIQMTSNTLPGIL
jgi:alpha 1,3-glucosidase